MRMTVPFVPMPRTAMVCAHGFESPRFCRCGRTAVMRVPMLRKFRPVGSASSMSRGTTCVCCTCLTSTTGLAPVTITVSSRVPSLSTALAVAVKLSGTVSPSASLAAARRDGHKLLTIDCVDRRRGIHPGAGVELPEEVAGFRVVGEEVTRDITPGPDEHHVAGGNDRPGLAPALEAPLPDEL